MSWLEAVPALLAAVAVAFVPGLAAGWVLGLRSLVLLAVSPALSAAIAVGSALGASVLGVPWNPTSAAISTVIAVTICTVARVAVRWPASEPPSVAGTGMRLVLAGGIAAGIVTTLIRLMVYIGAADAVSQTNDAMFHLSALRFAMITGGASPLEINEVIGAQSFYPSGWHVWASLVGQLAAVPVEVAANATSVVIAAVVWPLGLGALALRLGGPVAGGVAAALATAVPAFPLMMLEWGVLYPQLLAVALLPAAVLALLLPAAGDARVRSRIRNSLVVVAGSAAVAAAQPSVLLIFGVAVVALIASSVLVARSMRGRLALSGAALVAAAGLIGAWWFFGRSVSSIWPPSSTVAEAVTEVVVTGYLGQPWALGVSALAVLGAVAAAMTPRTRWVLPVVIVVVALFVVAAAVGDPRIRSLVVGPWYQDPYRLAAVVPVVVLPLAGIGAAALVTWLGLLFRPERRRWFEPAAGGALTAAVALTASLSLTTGPNSTFRDVFTGESGQEMYAADASALLSEDEAELLRRLADTVPADAVVVGNPGTGAGFGYALSGRDVQPRTWAPLRGDAYAVLWRSLREVESDPSVCPALDALGAEYVLDFGPGEEYPGRWIMPGFDGIGDFAGFELVDSEGDASLWRVVACG